MVNLIVMLSFHHKIFTDAGGAVVHQRNDRHVQLDEVSERNERVGHGFQARAAHARTCDSETMYRTDMESVTNTPPG